MATNAEKIVDGLLEGTALPDLLRAYGLDADSSTKEIAWQAVLHGDANPDGTLN